MGVLLQFVDGQTRQSLNLTGHEQLSIYGLSDDIQPHQSLDVEVKRADGSQDRFKVLCRIDTLNEVEYFKAGGILHYVLRNLTFPIERFHIIFQFSKPCIRYRAFFIASRQDTLSRNE